MNDIQKITISIHLRVTDRERLIAHARQADPYEDFENDDTNVAAIATLLEPGGMRKFQEAGVEVLEWGVDQC